jgi:hypothetical protein
MSSELSELPRIPTISPCGILTTGNYCIISHIKQSLYKNPDSNQITFSINDSGLIILVKINIEDSIISDDDEDGISDQRHIILKFNTGLFYNSDGILITQLEQLFIISALDSIPDFKFLLKNDSNFYWILIKILNLTESNIEYKSIFNSHI